MLIGDSFLRSRPLSSGRRAGRAATNVPAVDQQPFLARQPGNMRKPIGVDAAGTAVRLLPGELGQRGERSRPSAGSGAHKEPRYHHAESVSSRIRANRRRSSNCESISSNPRFPSSERVTDATLQIPSVQICRAWKSKCEKTRFRGTFLLADSLPLLLSHRCHFSLCLLPFDFFSFQVRNFATSSLEYALDTSGCAHAR